MASDVVRSVLEHVWKSLEPLGYPIALMGGLSLAAWNHIRGTRDVDVLIAVDRAAIDEVIALLIASGCQPKKRPPLLTVGDHCFVQFLYTPPDAFYDVQFDLLLAETELQRSAINRRVIRNVPGVDAPIAVLSCEDLILFKMLAGRVIDRADAAMLLRENRDQIDFDYLTGWIKRQKLEPEYLEIWREAFPGEADPQLD
jgi:hypothetical protein